jgi:hypothetical protein
MKLDIPTTGQGDSSDDNTKSFTKLPSTRETFKNSTIDNVVGEVGSPPMPIIPNRG